MRYQSALTSKLLKVLNKLNKQPSSESSVCFLLLNLEESNPQNQTRNRISKICHALKITSIIDPWKWIDNLEELKKIRSEGRHFGLLKWREETKEDGVDIVRFCNLIMVDSEYLDSNEYQDIFQLSLVKQSRHLTQLFLLQLRLSCIRLPTCSFGEEIVEEILVAVGYLSHVGDRRDSRRAENYDIIPSWDFRSYQKLSLSNFPDILKDSIQMALFILTTAALAIPGIDLASKLSSGVLLKGFDKKDLDKVADFSQFISLEVLYLTLVGLLVLLTVVTKILLTEKRSNAVALLTGLFFLLIIESLFAFLIYITCLFVIGLNLITTQRITIGVGALLMCLGLYLVLFTRNALIFRWLLSLLRTVLVALRICSSGYSKTTSS